MSVSMIFLQAAVAVGMCAWTLAGCFNPDAMPLARLVISFPVVALALYAFITTCKGMTKKDPSVNTNQWPWR
ncbi:hypothetical protein ACXIVK_35785 [Paraburkholderia caledonica]